MPCLCASIYSYAIWSQLLIFMIVHPKNGEVNRYLIFLMVCIFRFVSFRFAFCVGCWLVGWRFCQQLSGSESISNTQQATELVYKGLVFVFEFSHAEQYPLSYRTKTTEIRDIATICFPTV